MIDETIAELRRRGATIEGEPRTTRPDVRTAFIEGPEGIAIEIFNRGAGDFNPLPAS